MTQCSVLTLVTLIPLLAALTCNFATHFLNHSDSTSKWCGKYLQNSALLVKPLLASTQALYFPNAPRERERERPWHELCVRSFLPGFILWLGKNPEKQSLNTKADLESMKRAQNIISSSRLRLMCLFPSFSTWKTI